jgi:hypothetical protein
MATSRKTAEVDRQMSNPCPDVEYRVVWNRFESRWEIHRNGVATGVSRRKKQPAIDVAIRALLDEKEMPKGDVVVKALKDETLTILRIEPSGPASGHASLL